VAADLGGGGGALLAAVLKSNPHLRGMLVDREESILAAKARFQTEDFSSRCDLIVADLIQAVPAGADVYMLKHVLHGCTDEVAVAILKNCRAVIPDDGRLLIMEFVLPAIVSHADPQLEGRLMSDLNMLAVTGGKERSELQWRDLIDSAGFKLRQIQTPKGEKVMEEYVSVIAAEPV
jgi:hypothetical protein